MKAFVISDAGLNLFDILQTQGRYQTQPPRPFILSTEFAGAVAAAPAGSPFKRGDRSGVRNALWQNA